MSSALILCRFAHFAVVLLLLLFGICLFRTWLFKPLLAEAATATLDAKLTWILRSLASVALASSLLWLVLIAGSMAGSWQDGLDPPTLTLVLRNTFFGQVWSGHLLLSALLLISLASRRFSSPNLRLALSTLLLATLAPVGHGAMFDGSALEGRARHLESDMLLVPDADSLVDLGDGVARAICTELLVPKTSTKLSRTHSTASRSSPRPKLVTRGSRS